MLLKKKNMKSWINFGRNGCWVGRWRCFVARMAPARERCINKQV